MRHFLRILGFRVFAAETLFAFFSLVFVRLLLAFCPIWHCLET
jgi:hypothetical protein